MKKILTLLTCLLVSTASVFADLPFRNWRYDSFKVLKVSSENTVFIGNSITNMHEWWEAFGDNNVINRGVSGAVSDETIANLGSITKGQPKKAFLMIGTNDLGSGGTPETVLANIRIILDRFKAESPATKLYVQSILPSPNGSRTLENEQKANELIQELLKEYEGVTYIDLWDDMMPITDWTYSADKLHPNAKGYKVWCDKIAPYVLDREDATSTYTENTINYQGENNSWGMRFSQFGWLPLNDGDIIMLGDDVIHGGEWHELLHSAKVKDRGTGWGYNSVTISRLKASLPQVFGERTDKGKPAQVCIYIGATDVAGNSTASAIATSYMELVESVHNYAPEATIHLISIFPNSNATSTAKAAEVNAAVKTKAEALSYASQVKYVDAYSTFVSNGVASTAYFNGNYLYAKGYAKLSQIIAASINEVAPGTVTPVSDEEADEEYDKTAALMALDNAVINAGKFPVGNGAGEYSEANAAALTAALAAANALKQGDATNEQLEAAAKAIQDAMDALLPLINMPLASTSGEVHGYKMYTPNRGNKYLTSQGAGKEVAGLDAHDNLTGIWKFVLRTDGKTYDIVNLGDGSYLDNTAAYNKALSTVTSAPATGWKFSYSDAPGTYIVTSGTVQLNMSNHNTNVWNWGGGDNREDAGCQYRIVETELPEVLPLPAPLLTLTDLELDGSHAYRVKKSVADKIFAADELTIVMDITPSAAAGNNGAPSSHFFVASANEEGDDCLGYMVRNTNQLGIQYRGAAGTEGWFTQSTPAYAVGQRVQVIYKTNNANKLHTIYLNGALVRSIGDAAPNWPFHSLGSVEDVTGLFIGGVKKNGTTDVQNGFKGTIHSIRFYGVDFTDNQRGQLTYDDVTGETGKAFLEDADTKTPEFNTEVTIDLANGTLVRDDGKSSAWKNHWTSNDDITPTVTMMSDNNNMQAGSDGVHIDARSGLNKVSTYTLSVPDGYLITGFSLDFTAVSPSDPEAITYKDKKYTGTAELQNISDSGLKDNILTFTVNGTNTGVLLQNFVINIDKGKVEEKAAFEVFQTFNTEDAVPYRIPAIAQAKNGNLIAVADYRYGKADIGYGRVDLWGRISTDNGLTWGDRFQIVDYKQYTEGRLDGGFGDPCIVADRESDRVLLMSCSGKVGFPNGTRDNHQGIARFYSEDNGVTWSAPEDISESIYSLFDNSTIGTPRSMFIGSGRIFQSHTVKAGDYYRLYCSNLYKDVNGVNKNYVLYSDDFGQTWNVLGGADVAPIPSGADEPKAEELPDGSIVCSSRKTNGRWFNIFHFTDTEKAEGYWDECVSSDGSNNGVAATSNTCNGEIMIVPAVNKENGKEAFIALQSLPMAANRSNVSIRWKVLESLADYTETADFAKDWDGGIRVSKIGSAYSTMALLDDNTIGFLYEEETHGAGYTIVYKNYTLEEITGDAYGVKTEASRDENVKAGMEARMDALKEKFTRNVGDFSAESAENLQKAYDAYMSAPSKALYEAFNAAVCSAKRNGVDANIVYRLRNVDRQNGTLYLICDADDLTAAALDATVGSQLFQFVPAGEGTWYVKNHGSDLYIGSTGLNEKRVPVVTTREEAAPYVVRTSATGTNYLVCQTPGGPNSALHLAGDCIRIVPWVAEGSPASGWAIEATDLVTAIEAVEEAGHGARIENYYDLSGRRVSAPVKGGIYVTDKRRKVIMK